MGFAKQYVHTLTLPMSVNISIYGQIFFSLYTPGPLNCKAILLLTVLKYNRTCGKLELCLGCLQKASIEERGYKFNWRQVGVCEGCFEE